MRSPRLDRHREIVARFEAVARANVGKLAQFADLCRAAGVSPRSLSRAFQTAADTTPYRFVQTLRLTAVRQALLARTEDETVTDVATRFGFHELGRFAALYRDAFGESPSETKRRNAPDDHVSSDDHPSVD